MKFIQKTSPPNEYTTWCKNQESLGVNYNYRSLQNPQKSCLHKALIKEQGSICGYTMKRIDRRISHIEHIKPRYICEQEGQGIDLDYHNLIAAYPREGMRRNCRYGAQAKDNWWESNGDLFHSPVKFYCELKFIFNIDGEIFPIDNQRENAINTISVLKLDDPELTNDRKLAIEAFIFEDQPLTPEEIDEAIDAIWQPNDEGVLWEFCIAIHDALYEYKEMLQSIE